MQWRTNQTRCVSCPLEGVFCDRNQSAIHLMPNYFLPTWDDAPSDDFSPEELATPKRCPMLTACLGGTEHGDASCAEGHSGPFCGVCVDGYFRSRTGCDLCPQVGQVNSITYLVLALLAVAAFIGTIVIFMSELGVSGSHVQRPSGRRQRGGRIRRYLWRIMQSVSLGRVEINTALKIILAYVQVVGTFMSFGYVRWPSAFVNFMSFIEFPLDLELIPYEVHSVHKKMTMLLARVYTLAC